MTGPFTVRDRENNPITTHAEKGISTDDWRWAVYGPKPPFAFGRVIALFISEADAIFFASVCNNFTQKREKIRNDIYDSLPNTSKLAFEYYGNQILKTANCINPIGKINKEN